MSEKTYQGWTNYETWCAALHISNDEGSYRHWECRQADECYREAVGGDKDGDRDGWTETAADQLAEQLEAEFEDNAPDLGGMYGDMLRAALGEVNWYEIAKSYIENLERDEIEADIIPQPEEEEEEEDEEEGDE